MSQPDGTITKIYKALADMTPETRNLWLDAINRAIEVYQEADATLTEQRQQKEPIHTSDATLTEQRKQKEPIDTSKLGENIDYTLGENIDYTISLLDQMNHTRKGGSIKRSINCRRPRGFSQRQHCKYGRRQTTRRRRQSRSSRD